MKASVSLVLFSLVLAGCSSGNSTQTAAQGSPTPATVSPQSAPTPEQAQMAAAEAAAKARVRDSAKEFGEATMLLGADPVPAIRGRIETCFSGDKKAFASFYVPELASAFATDSRILDFDFQHECGGMTASQPRPDLDARFKAVKVFAKRSELYDRPTGNPIYRLCVTDQDAEHCARPGANWTNSVVVREGHVLFVD
jgi:hypothetical protein